MATEGDESDLNQVNQDGRKQDKNRELLNRQDQSPSGEMSSGLRDEGAMGAPPGQGGS